MPFYSGQSRVCSEAENQVSTLKQQPGVQWGGPHIFSPLLSAKEKLAVSGTGEQGPGGRGDTADTGEEALMKRHAAARWQVPGTQAQGLRAGGSSTLQE